MTSRKLELIQFLTRKIFFWVLLLYIFICVEASRIRLCCIKEKEGRKFLFKVPSLYKKLNYFIYLNIMNISSLLFSLLWTDAFLHDCKFEEAPTNYKCNKIFFFSFHNLASYCQRSSSFFRSPFSSKFDLSLPAKSRIAG